MGDFTFTDKPNQQRIQATLNQFTQNQTASANLAVLFLNFQWTYRNMQQAYNELLADYQLSESKFIILMFLQQAPDQRLLPSELAERLGSSRATVTKLLNSMEKTGLIEKQPSVTDKRAVLIQLTAQGNDTLRAFLPENFDAVQLFMGALSAEEIDQFATLLNKIQQGTDALNHERKSPTHE